MPDVETKEERINRIHRDQVILRELMERFPQHTSKAMRQSYYDLNFLLHELASQGTASALAQAEAALHLVLNTDPVNGAHVRIAKKYFDEKVRKNE